MEQTKPTTTPRTKITTMNNNIILIGPVGVGKTSVANELSTKLNLPIISMDTVRISYYKELGYDPELAETLYEKDGPQLSGVM